MKAWIIALTLGAGLATSASADPILGTWKTEVDDGAFAHVEMAPCGSKFCGKITRTFTDDGEVQSPQIGRTIVIDMENNGGGAYAGQVFRPSNGKTYIGKMNLSGNSLDLRGCVAGGLLCAKQTWSRIN